jgi:hypothetical protein
MNYIHERIPKETRVILVPSTNEIQHIYPLPQPKMNTSMFDSTKMRRENNMPVLASNPAIFELNDIKVGIINTDVIKDVCVNMCVKNSPVEPG